MTDAIAPATDELRIAVIHAISIAGHTLTTNEVYRVADAVMVPVRERDAAQRAEIERLREALQPFADEAEDFADSIPDESAWKSDYSTVGDLRAAHAALEKQP